KLDRRALQVLYAGLSSPGDLLSPYTAGESRQDIACRQASVTAHCALGRWSIAMACSYVAEEGSAPHTQEMHDRGNDQFVVVGTYLVLHSFNQLIQICRNSSRSLCRVQWRFQYGLHRPSPLFCG